MCDRRPAKMLFYPPAPVASHRFTQLRVERNLIDTGGQTARELVRVDGVKGIGLKLEVDQQPSFARDDHLRDTADRGSDDGRLTCHRLQVDDAERLVYRRAAEHRRVGV